MGSDVGQIFPTASFHRDHSILYALVCEIILSHIPVPARGKDKRQTAARRLHAGCTVICDVIVMFK